MRGRLRVVAPGRVRADSILRQIPPDGIVAGAGEPWIGETRIGECGATLKAGERLNRQASLRYKLSEGRRRLIEVTPQEEQLLNSLVERVNQTQLQEKDPDAEALLNRALGANPDAHYILAQTVLVQNIALEQAKAQVSQLQQQVAQAQQHAQARPVATSFLGGLLGHHDPPPAPSQPLPPQQSYAPVGQAQPPYGQTAPGYQPVQQPGYAPVGQPQYMAPGQPQFVPVGGGQPSFLRGAMQTAAGVAAGALAFEGVEAVLHGIGGMGHPGYGSGVMGGGFGGGVMNGACM